MKKIINLAENYTDDMLRGIYAAHAEAVCPVGEDLRCYRRRRVEPGKVALITGGGTGHLPLFLGYVGAGALDGCAVGSVFQSPTPEQVCALAKALDGGAGVLYIYGNYSGDVMCFDMATELCPLDGIACASILGADDVHSGAPALRRGVAGIFFMYKAAGARAAEMASLDEVLAAAQKAKDNTRTVGFALSACVIPELGRPGFVLGEQEMAMGMGIHGEPGIWTGPLKPARAIAEESLQAILDDMPVAAGEEVCLLINGLGATSLEELYILAGDVYDLLGERGISVYRSFVGEFATSMEMAGASVSLCRVDAELKRWIDSPVDTPFYRQSARAAVQGGED